MAKNIHLSDEVLDVLDEVGNTTDTWDDAAKKLIEQWRQRGNDLESLLEVINSNKDFSERVDIDLPEDKGGSIAEEWLEEPENSPFNKCEISEYDGDEIFIGRTDEYIVTVRHTGEFIWELSYILPENTSILKRNFLTEYNVPREYDGWVEDVIGVDKSESYRGVDVTDRQNVVVIQKTAEGTPYFEIKHLLGDIQDVVDEVERMAEVGKAMYRSSGGVEDGELPDTISPSDFEDDASQGVDE